ncbi:MAG: DUF86 domain-containing protein [Methanocorpusculum sp.]|nr:DUF86 domain-containing protein [Methanocorpusculum sp.]
MKPSDRLFLCHIHDEILFLDEVTADLTFEMLDSDKRSQHIVQKSIEIIGEAGKQISDELKTSCPDIPWRQVAGMRDRLTHGYFDINWELVWIVLHDDIPRLKKCVEKILDTTQ